MCFEYLDEDGSKCHGEVRRSEIEQDAMTGFSVRKIAEKVSRTAFMGTESAFEGKAVYRIFGRGARCRRVRGSRTVCVSVTEK